MSERTDADALEAAIAENPEAVAGLIRRLDAVNELLDVLSLGEAALTDEMVRELAATGETLGAAADGLATDETVELAERVGAEGEQLGEALESLVALQQSGALEDLVELAEVASLATAALDDEMVRSLAGTGANLGELADTATEEDVRDGLAAVLGGVGEATAEPPERIGPLGLLGASRDPDVQYGLGYLVALAAAIGRDRRPE